MVGIAGRIVEFDMCALVCFGGDCENSSVVGDALEHAG